ncbi:MAG TPA: hypothetical protein VJ999_11435 [Candidatus Sulfotelmatobacter sp.]|nr:hypothetical protein [Candidatus Sulfotelmatobacter sp.]
MIKKNRMPISGGAGQFRPTPNVLSNAADTSRDGQKLVKASPTPFQSRNGTVDVPAPTHPSFRANSQFSKDLLKYGAKGRSVSVRNPPTVNLAAVGEPRLPKGYNPIISGFPTRGVTRAVGGGNQPSANWAKGPSAKQRAQYPGIFGSTRYRP